MKVIVGGNTWDTKRDEPIILVFDNYADMFQHVQDIRGYLDNAKEQPDIPFMYGVFPNTVPEDVMKAYMLIEAYRLGITHIQEARMKVSEDS